MNVSDLMTKKVITAKLKTSIFDAATMMKEYDIGFLPVVDDDTLVGCITDRDIVIRAIFNRARMNQSIIKYMTSTITSISSNKSIDDAILLMSNKRIKRLPVLDNEKLVGIISLADIINQYDDKEKIVDLVRGIHKINKRMIDKHKTKVDDFKL